MSTGAIVAIVIGATRHPPDAGSQASEDQHHPYEPDHQFVRRLAAGFRHSHSRGLEIGKGLRGKKHQLSARISLP